MYNVFFHPLRAYPGPKLWAGFRFPYVYHQVKGRLPYRAKQLHDRYGSVARIAPNELSYVTAAAWKDVYGTRQGHPQNPKDLAAFPALHPGQSVDLVRANDADHARHRRLLSHAFSAKALDDQQPIVLSYVDLLIQRLRENAARPQDMVAWYNWTSADIIGDLAFGESFHGLRDQQWHPWVKTMTQGLETGLILAAARRYKLDFLLKSVIPKATMESFEQAFAYSKEKVEARIQRGADRPDFMSYIMRNDQKGREMSRGEIDANAEVLAVAGSETTASFLSGATYYLCMNPRIREKVTKEIRDVFDADQDINLSLLSKIEYLSAVLKESLRLYPPAPGSMPRVTANSEMICGRWTPAGVRQVRSFSILLLLLLIFFSIGGFLRWNRLTQNADIRQCLPVARLPLLNQLSRTRLLRARALAVRGTRRI